MKAYLFYQWQHPLCIMIWLSPSIKQMVDGWLYKCFDILSLLIAFPGRFYLYLSNNYDLVLWIVANKYWAWTLDGPTVLCPPFNHGRTMDIGLTPTGSGQACSIWQAWASRSWNKAQWIHYRWLHVKMSFCVFLLSFFVLSQFYYWIHISLDGFIRIVRQNLCFIFKMNFKRIKYNGYNP